MTKQFKENTDPTKKRATTKFGTQVIVLKEVGGGMVEVEIINRNGNFITVVDEKELDYE
jgi:hypothetical protein